MSNMFGSSTPPPAPPPPTPTPPPTMPDPFGPATLEARRVAMARAASAGGRDSTILTTAASRGQAGATLASGAAGGATKLGAG